MSKTEPLIFNSDHPLRKGLLELASHLGEIANNPALYEEENFDLRANALDFIDFHFPGTIEDLPDTTEPNEPALLQYRVEKIRSELEKVDNVLFEKLRANIRKKEYTGNKFGALLKEYVDFDLENKEHQQEPGYDNLDLFINRLLSVTAIPEQTKNLEPGMIYYQKTPARIVLEMAKGYPFRETDVFFDLGSGLGQVAILLKILTGVTVEGIEFEPAFCHYANDCAAQLNLPEVTFINCDARIADYSKGTIFFMFTPFTGEILQDVLALLRKESLQRKITLITYGPCTAEVASQSWLRSKSPEIENNDKLAVYVSCI